MNSLYALLVGIDAYQPPVRPLRGCRNDIDHAHDYLRARIDPSQKLYAVVLQDEQATRQAVIDGFRQHLGQAGPADTALFWFCGHGSLAPVPPELAHTEPTGMLQTMLCVDSRRGGVPDLLDKELAVLIAEVAARDAHVVVVLDSCHANSGSREGASLQMRWESALTEPPPVAALLAELQQSGAAAVGVVRPTAKATHVCLAACQTHEAAHEVGRPGGHRGAFSLALLTQLDRQGPAASYRQLMAGARCTVEDLVRSQLPALYPVTEPLADLAFLGGQLTRPQSTMTMRFVRGGWEIDAGACHGMVAGTAADPTCVGVPDADPPQQARILQVHTERSTVTPFDWVPDQTRLYPIVLTSVPLPATTVAINSGPGYDDQTAARLVAALRSSSHTGTTSPYVRLVDPADPTELAEIVVETPAHGVVRISDPEGHQLAPNVLDVNNGERAARVVATVEHMARWRQVRGLRNPQSRLAAAVTLEVVPMAPGELAPPAARTALPTDRSGAVLLDYRPDGTGWVAPEAFIRLRNTADSQLYCVLLDLTDRFRVHAELFPGDYIGAHYAAWAGGGLPIEFSLPTGRPVHPGSVARDWLKLLVSARPFSSELFDLPAIGEPYAPPSARRSVGLGGALDRLGLTVMNRDAGRRRTAADDWTTSIHPVVTRVPNGKS